MTPKIFISYRRSDSRAIAGRIYDHLSDAFGEDKVFKDSYDIIPGDDFRGKLREAVSQCDIVLVIIGPAWLTVAHDDGTRRLDDPTDWVRIEVETALQRDEVRVIPVLVDGAKIPAAEELPESLRELAFKQAAPIRDDPDFHTDIERLIRILGGSAAKAPIIRPESPPQQRMLEAAMPSCTQLGTATEARIKISLPGSAGLRAELPDVIPSGDVIQQGDVRSSAFQVQFPQDQHTGQMLPRHLCVEVSSDDFLVSAAAMGRDCAPGQVGIDLSPDADSRTLIFSLHPKDNQRLGPALIGVRIYAGSEILAETALSTRLVHSLSEHPICTTWMFSAMRLGYPAPPPQPIMPPAPRPASAPGQAAEEAVSAGPPDSGAGNRQRETLAGGIDPQAGEDRYTPDEYPRMQPAAPLQPQRKKGRSPYARLGVLLLAAALMIPALALLNSNSGQPTLSITKSQEVEDITQSITDSGTGDEPTETSVTEAIIVTEALIPTQTPPDCLANIKAPRTGVSARPISIYEGPGTDYRRVGSVTYPGAMEVFGESADGEWLRVNYRTSLGNDTWIAKDEVEFVMRACGLLPVVEPFPTQTP